MSEDRTAVRPLVILEFVASQNDSVTLRDVQDATGYPKSSVWLILRQLQEAGFLRLSAPNRFAPGTRLVQMGLAIYDSSNLMGDGRRALQSLAEQTGMDVYLAIRVDDDVVYSDRIFGARSIQIRRALGEPRPLHASAAGKLFLAFDSDGLWQRKIAGHQLEAFTAQTTAGEAELQGQLTEARNRAFIVSDSEVLLGISSVAAMAFNSDGSPWAAVVVSAHEADLNPVRSQVIDNVVATAHALTILRSRIEKSEATPLS